MAPSMRERRQREGAFIVVYRIGNQENFEWLQTDQLTMQEAIDELQECSQKGFLATRQNYRIIEEYGVPKTFDGSDKFYITQ